MDQAFYIHSINPVAIQIGSFGIKWYSLAYFFGVIIGWQYCRMLLRKYSFADYSEIKQTTPINNIIDGFLSNILTSAFIMVPILISTSKN